MPASSTESGAEQGGDHIVLIIHGRADLVIGSGGNNLTRCHLSELFNSRFTFILPQREGQFQNLSHQ